LPPDSPPASNYQTTTDTVLDLTTGLEWQREIAARPQVVDGVSADAVCQGVPAGGGPSFRVPSRMELLTLLFFDKFGPTINAQAFPDDPLAEDHVWTRSVSPSSGSSGTDLWAVSFQSTGLDAIIASGQPEQVRCVRVAEVKSTGAAPHYTVAGGLARDNWTRLSWAVEAPSYAVFAPAEAYCNALKLGPFTSGFRAPSMKELWSLWDETASSGPLWDQAVFGGAPGGTPQPSTTTFWSTTMEFGASTNRRALDFWAAATLVGDNDTPAGYRIRCVHD
jgi:hypothetical protein